MPLPGHVDLRPTILVVDDEPTLLTLMEESLTKEGYPVLTATNGVDALNALASHGPDIYVVLLDLFMPGIDGMGVIRHLVNIHTHIVGIVIVTGHSSADSLAEFHHLGTDNILPIDYLTKPFNWTDLYADVEKTVQLVHDKRINRGLVHLGEVAQRLESVERKLDTLSARLPGFLGSMGQDVAKAAILAAFVMGALYFNLADWLRMLVHRIK